MPIECVWFDEVPDRPFKPGWCFPMGYDLSNYYKTFQANVREPISVCLPRRDDSGHGTPFCVDSFPTKEPEAAWNVVVTGELVEGKKPDITVSPSIKAEGIYHGFLTNGVLTDDIGH